MDLTLLSLSIKVFEFEFQFSLVSPPPTPHPPSPPALSVCHQPIPCRFSRQVVSECSTCVSPSLPVTSATGGWGLNLTESIQPPSESCRILPGGIDGISAASVQSGSVRTNPLTIPVSCPKFELVRQTYPSPAQSLN